MAIAAYFFSHTEIGRRFFNRISSVETITTDDVHGAIDKAADGINKAKEGFNKAKDVYNTITK